MVYEIKFLPSLQKTINKMDPYLKHRMNQKLEALALNPSMGDKLKGISDTTYRIKVGKYRVLYQIKDKELIILVINFGHRKEIYRDL